MVWTRAVIGSLLPSRREGSMAIEMKVLRLDIARNVFQVHGVDLAVKLFSS
jgi:hypothetical protein